MSEIPTIDQIQQMSDEEVVELKRKLAKKLIRNVIIFAAIKATIYYGLHRWAKAAAKSN